MAAQRRAPRNCPKPRSRASPAAALPGDSQPARSPTTTWPELRSKQPDSPATDSRWRFRYTSSASPPGGGSLTARISCVADEPRPPCPTARRRTEAGRPGAPISHVSCMRSLGFAAPRLPGEKYSRLNLYRRRLVGELNSTRRRLDRLARRGPAGSLDSQRRGHQTRLLARSGATPPTSGPRRLRSSSWPPRRDSLTRTPVGGAAANGRPTLCAAFRPGFKTVTQSQSRVNLDQAAGPRTGNNLALNSTRNGSATRRWPAVATSDGSLRPVAEA